LTRKYGIAYPARVQLLASEEYGLRCLLQVARGHGGAPVAVPEVAAAEGLSLEYAAKLLRQLRLAGLVRSRRGASGGYELARAPDAISVWSALEALGGEFFAGDFCACHPGARRRCVRASDCSLRALWRRVQAALREALAGVTLADLARDEQAMGAWLAPRAGGAALIQIEGGSHP
jgi:Rrf2 family protein